MQLFYYKSENGNVGDDLNAALWPKVFGDGFFNDHSQTRFVGIGSVFDDRHPALAAGQRHIVFGAGIRSRRTMPKALERFDIKFVRGPLSARLLPGDVTYISDPAIIAPRFLPAAPREAVRGRVGFVPYYKTSQALQKKLAAQFDLHLISPSLSPADFIAELGSCETVISEAMHGAILADAYRIPWSALRLESAVHEGRTSFFKWQDWMESLAIRADIASTIPRPLLYSPHKLRSVFAGYAATRASQIVARVIKEEAFQLSDDARLMTAQDQILAEVETLKMGLVAEGLAS